MRRVVCLALIALTILTAMPVLAAEDMTDTEFLYRYMGLLSILDVRVNSEWYPRSEESSTATETVTIFDRCTIMYNPDDRIVNFVSLRFESGELEYDRAAAFLLALNPDYYYDEYKTAQDLYKVDSVTDALRKATEGNAIEYAGYYMEYQVDEHEARLVGARL